MFCKGYDPKIKSTFDQLLEMRKNLIKTRERRIDTFHFVIDFKVAFDSTIRSCLYAAMFENSIPEKHQKDRSIGKDLFE